MDKDKVISEFRGGTKTVEVDDSQPTSGIADAALEMNSVALNTRGLLMLREGKVILFNALREEHPDWNPDFSDAELPGVDLSGAKLNRAELARADLTGAKLIGTDFSDTYLIDAKLTWADLSGARFNDAQLSRAKLYDAKLTRADLTGAKLDDAKLTRADLSGARLIEARLTGADLSGANLSQVIGLTAEQLATSLFYQAHVDPALLEATFVTLRRKTNRSYG